MAGGCSFEPGLYLVGRVGAQHRPPLHREPGSSISCMSRAPGIRLLERERTHIRQAEPSPSRPRTVRAEGLRTAPDDIRQIW